MNFGKLLFKNRTTGQPTTNRLVRAIVLTRCNNKCQRCGRQYNKKLAEQCPDLYFSELHIDHIIPFDLGGRNSLDNYQALCSDCNLKKGTTVYED